MSGLDKILEHITDEAQKEAEKILNSARTEADKILSSGKAETDALTAAIVKQSEADVASSVQRIKSAAQLKEKRILLQAKQDKIEEVFKGAVDYLTHLDEDAYFEIICRMISRYASGEKGEILFNASDLQRLPAAVKEEAASHGLTVSDKKADISGGFILSYGDIEENCSFEVLIETSREELQDKVGQLLFS